MRKVILSSETLQKSEDLLDARKHARLRSEMPVTAVDVVS